MEPGGGPGRAAGLTLLAGGTGLLALAVVGLIGDIGWLAQPFYAWAWWGWILLLDGACRLRRGHSLLSRLGRRIPAFLLWSTTFWFFFELLNLRFRNWYYVGVPKPQSLLDLLGGALFAFACFSTVFTGLFETADALAAFGLRGRRGGGGGGGSPAPSATPCSSPDSSSSRSPSSSPSTSRPSSGGA